MFSGFHPFFYFPPNTSSHLREGLLEILLLQQTAQCESATDEPIQEKSPSSVHTDWSGAFQLLEYQIVWWVSRFDIWVGPTLPLLWRAFDNIATEECVLSVCWLSRPGGWITRPFHGSTTIGCPPPTHRLTNFSFIDLWHAKSKKQKGKNLNAKKHFYWMPTTHPPSDQLLYY